MAEFDPTNYGGDGEAGKPDDVFGVDPDMDEEDGQGEMLNPKDALLLVIDCVPVPGGSEKSLVKEALSVAASVLKTKIIQSPEDKVGVVLYGVRNEKNPNNFAGIHVLLELDQPDAGRIRALEDEEKRSTAQFEERYGCDPAVPVSDVFWTCSTIFNLAAVNTKQWLPRVFVFTWNDNPCASPEHREAAQTRARDLQDLGVVMELFALPSPGKKFEMNPFWGSVLVIDDEDYVSRVESNIEELHRRTLNRAHRKRTLQRLMLELTPGVEFAVSVFANLIPAFIPSPVYLLNENNKQLKSETKLICEQTAAILHPLDDIDTYVELAGERVYISSQEMQQVKKFGEPGMRLLGFKPKECLKGHHNLTHSYFVYPNEKSIVGSSTCCAALIDCMVAKDKIAIVRYLARTNSLPVIAALVPQQEVFDADGNQLKSAGFNMILLPFQDDIRPLNFPAVTGVAISEESMIAAHQVVESFKLDGWQPVENPVIQKHYAAVQALALGQDEPDKVEDMLQPDDEHIAEKAQVMQDWWSAVGSGVPKGVKRPGEAGGPAAKKVKVKDEVPFDGSKEAMKAKIESGEISSMTMGVIRDWLKAQGVCTTGKKDDLIERVKAVL